MSELRKPLQVWLLRKQGNKKAIKVEIFNARQWNDGIKYCHGCKSPKYRLRINGKWFFNNNKQKYFGKTEFKNMFFNSIDI